MIYHFSHSDGKIILLKLLKLFASLFQKKKHKWKYYLSIPKGSKDVTLSLGTSHKTLLHFHTI